MSSERHAKLCLDAVAATVPGRIIVIALRQCPALPPMIAERIRDYRVQNVADWVLCLKALAAAAEARSWIVHWSDARKVLDAAERHWFLQLRRSIGPPWSKDHRSR
jgi:hypothetical protein